MECKTTLALVCLARNTLRGCEHGVTDVRKTVEYF